MEINFDWNANPVSGHIFSYLLEKKRVVNKWENEIFIAYTSSWQVLIRTKLMSGIWTEAPLTTLTLIKWFWSLDFVFIGGTSPKWEHCRSGHREKSLMKGKANTENLKKFIFFSQCCSSRSGLHNQCFLHEKSNFNLGRYLSNMNSLSF